MGERLQPSGIKLARMDVTSRGGMRAWKKLDLERVPSVKVGLAAVSVVDNKNAA